MAAIFVLIALGFAFMIHMAKGGHVGIGGVILVLFVIALIISAAFSVDFSIVVILMLGVIAIVVACSVLTSIEDSKEQEKKQQEENISKQDFANALKTQLKQATNHVELHDYFAWITDTDFCWCDKIWSGLGTELTVNRVAIDDINYFISYCSMSDISKIAPLEGRFGVIPKWKIKNQNSTKMLYIKDNTDCVIDFHYNDYSIIIGLLPEKAQEKFITHKRDAALLTMMKKTPYKAFAQLADEIDDGMFGIKDEIRIISLLKKEICPHKICKWENGKTVWVYLSLEELRQELSLERSVYEIDDYRSGIHSITELEKQSRDVRNNTSKRRKLANTKIKDYIWKHYHELITAANVEESFQRWSYRFEKSYKEVVTHGPN